MAVCRRIHSPIAVVHMIGFGEPILDKLLPARIRPAKDCEITRTYIVSNASRLLPETFRKIIGSGPDR